MPFWFDRPPTVRAVQRASQRQLALFCLPPGGSSTIRGEKRCLVSGYNCRFGPSNGVVKRSYAMSADLFGGEGSAPDSASSSAFAGPALPPSRARRWLWRILGGFGLVLATCCGGCGLILWAFSSKPVNLSNLQIQRHGQFAQITLAYHVKGQSPSLGATELVVEGSGWTHRQPAFNGFRVPVTGKIFAIGPARWPSARRRGRLYLLGIGVSAGRHGLLLERHPRLDTSARRTMSDLHRRTKAGKHVLYAYETTGQPARALRLRASQRGKHIASLPT